MLERRTILRGLVAAPFGGIAAVSATTAKPNDSSGLVTIDQMAAQPFEAFDHTPDEWVPPSNEEWAAHADPILITTRIAWFTLYKSKDDLVGMVDTMWSTDEGEELFKTLIKNLHDAQTYFDRYQKVLNAAEVRLMCASAVACAGAEGGAA